MSTLTDAKLACEVVEIGPQLAEQLLARNSGNRAIRKNRVATLAQTMVDGKWMLNGEAIKIGEDGRLLDGQHRLAAIVQSGVTIRTLLIRGVADETFVTLDSGLGRSAADMLRTAGLEASAVAVAALVNLVISYEAGTPAAMGGKHIPRTATFERFSQDPERFSEAVRDGGRHQMRFRAHNRNYAGLLLFMAPESEPFLEKVTSGANLDKGAPALALRNFLMNSQGGGGRSSRPRPAMLAAYVHAWNAEAQGRQLQLIRPIFSPFPKIARISQKG